MNLDVDLARSFFPALQTDWALFENAGGSATPTFVIDRVRDHMSRCPVQLGGAYPLAREAERRVAEGHRAAEVLLGADEGEVILGPSTTANIGQLARALSANWKRGDEVIVTNLDHEANRGAWGRLAEAGFVVREWKLRPETAALELEDLELLLSERTRLVSFTHCANVAGRIHDVEPWIRRIHAAGALAAVDGVALAPHRSVDVKALDADFYFVSLYKVYGPRLGAMYGRRELLERARGQNHFFISEDEVPRKLEPGGSNHELTSAVPGILEYLEQIDSSGQNDGPRGALLRAFEAIEKHEEDLAERLLAFLSDHPRIRVIGPETADRAVRVPTIAFVAEEWESRALAEQLARHRLALSAGDFYAYRAMRSLGLWPHGGVVRASLVHYNTFDEVDRLVAGLEAELPRS